MRRRLPRQARKDPQDVVSGGRPRDQAVHGPEGGAAGPGKYLGPRIRRFGAESWARGRSWPRWRPFVGQEGPRWGSVSRRYGTGLFQTTRPGRA